MLPVGGRPLLEHTVERMRNAGCRRVVVVVGHLSDRIVTTADTVVNPDYLTTNILHSLMCARDYLEGPSVVSCSDIWVEPIIYDRLMSTDGDIVVAVDDDWRSYYEGREGHPISEAEKVVISEVRTVAKIGKLVDDQTDVAGCAEFLGLWRMSATGTSVFRNAFDELDTRLVPSDAFQGAAAWRQAYVTDMLQELSDRGVAIACAVVTSGWAELDTSEDYERLMSVAARQELTTLQHQPGS